MTKSKLLMLFIALYFIGVNAQTKKVYRWFELPYVEKKQTVFHNAKKLSLIKVKGNTFIDEQGNKIIFKGVSIADPDKIEYQGNWNKNLFAKARELGTNIIRIPIHPIAWRERTPDEYLKLLDQAVEWCSELEMYVIIDWHSIGNLIGGLFQDPSYNTTIEETANFWRTISERYAGNNTIAFYELYNEPTLYFGKLGSATWEEWKKINENLIRLVRAYDPETIPLVAGFDWAYDLTPLLIDPIDAEGIGYVTHPYPHKRSAPYEPKWDENFGFAAEKYPIVATELGFTLGKCGLAENGAYGEAIMNYFEKKGISWVWWVFDPHWHPNMLDSWDKFQLTESGEFYKQALNRNQSVNLNKE